MLLLSYQVAERFSAFISEWQRKCLVITKVQKNSIRINGSGNDSLLRILPEKNKLYTNRGL